MESQIPSSVMLLDCTLRDGGYYNNWDFDRDLVRRYLRSVARAGVDAIELGFRMFEGTIFQGAYAFTTDRWIATLELPTDTVLAVMVDATTLLSFDAGPRKAVSHLFSPANDSRISMVRVASHFQQVASCRDAVLELRDLGYSVGFNLMQSAGRPTDYLAETASVIERWGSVDVLYFADSFGNMDRVEVERVTTALRDGWAGPMGIHAHNNQGRAVDNSLHAMDLGVQWLDGTLLGMGRGAGNASTELLALELAKRGHKYDSEELWDLVLNDFTKLQEQFGWGPSLLYYFAAQNDIHPTYVQHLISEPRFGTERIIRALKLIASEESKSFDPDLASRSALGVGKLGDLEGDWDASGWCSGRDVLFLGAGPSLADHSDAVVEWVNRENPAVIALNFLAAFPHELVDLHVAVEGLRVALDGERYPTTDTVLVAPMKRLPTSVSRSLSAIKVNDYDMVVERGTFLPGPAGCVIPERLSMAYAFAISIVGGARRVFLAGFDGYSVGDPRRDEMIDMLSVVLPALPDSMEVTSITPTTYPINQASVYARI